MRAAAISEALETPVLLIIFNRPDTTRMVFEAIRHARPKKLYVAADGPRPGVADDVARCAQARDIALSVDWPCEVTTLLRDENLGCGRALSLGISWFFDHVSEGIILEDDCLPSPSFFWYCQELLDRYRDDQRVMHIGGNNFLEDDANIETSYYFSYCGHVWGWATWARAWRTYDFKMRRLPFLIRNGYFRYFFINNLERLYRLRKFNQVYTSKLDTWDYQWDFARFSNYGLSIVPGRNMVRNLGYGTGATHTKDGTHQYNRLKAHDLVFPLKHPKRVLRDVSLDKKYFTTLMVERVLSKLAVSYV